MPREKRCDLAVEAHEMAVKLQHSNRTVSGVDIRERDLAHDIHITEVEILNQHGAEAMGKDIGSYVTLLMPQNFDGSQIVYEAVCKSCAEIISSLCNPYLKQESDTVLIVGLGNRNITADALGPKVMESLMVTRHLKEYIPEEIDNRIRPVCAITPGVLGLTGMETGEIVKGVTEKIKPALVIAIDALCARNTERINSTIQFSDTGITPGEGVGNKRKALNQKSLGVPVIAIGVPTVVEALTIAEESFEKLTEYIITKALHFSDDAENDMFSNHFEQLFQDAIVPNFENFVVAPKEVDRMVTWTAKVIANGINIALHKGITLTDIDRFL